MATDTDHNYLDEQIGAILKLLCEQMRNKEICVYQGI